MVARSFMKHFYIALFHGSTLKKAYEMAATFVSVQFKLPMSNQIFLLLPECTDHEEIIVQK